MAKPENFNPQYLFDSDKAEYYDTPEGCLRTLSVDDGILVGTRYGKTYTIPLSQATPARKKKWSL